MSAASPLVLLHGFAGLPEVWDDSLAHLEVLAPGPRKLLPLPLAGHGIPAPQPGPGSFEAEVDRLAAEIRHSSSDHAPWHLAGYSMGGRLAVGLLCRHPGLFSGATLIGCHWGIEDSQERMERRRWDAGWASRLDQEGLDSFLDAWEDLDLFATQTSDQKTRFRRLRQTLEAQGLSAALRSFGSGAMPCYSRDLVGCQLPITWAAGALDSKFVESSSRAAAATPQAEARIVPGCGHNIVLEAPDAVAELLATASIPPINPDNEGT